MFLGVWLGIGICLVMGYVYQCRVNYLKSIQVEPAEQQDCCHSVEAVKQI